MNPKEMRERAGKAVKEMKALNERAGAAGRDFTDQERAQWDRLAAERDGWLARAERLEAEEGSGGPFTPAGPRDLGNAALPDFTGAGSPAQERPRAHARPRQFRNLFPRARLDNGGFRSLNEFCRTLAAGFADTRLTNLSQGEMSDPHGGFAVPSAFASELLDAALEEEIVRPRARVVPMDTNEMLVARWDGHDHSTGELFGGISADWTEELGELAESRGKLERLRLMAAKLTIYTRASNELLDDAPQFASGLVSALASTIGWKLDDAFLHGTGAGQPKGILADPALIAVSKEVSQAADTIVYANLVNMFARMYPGGRSRAVWIASNTTIPALLQLTIPIGDGGAFVPVMTRGPEGFEILTRPVLFTEKLPVLGDQGDILFADLSQYTVGLRQDMRLDRSEHAHFQTDETAFRSIVRADGQGSWATVMTPKNGDTLSWVVALAERD